MLDWIQENQTTLLWSAGLTVAMVIASAIIAPFVIVHLPEDYLRRNHTKKSSKHPALAIVRNIAGWLLIAAGLAMLILPGQGVIVLILGIILAEFPGKQRLLRWIITRPRILKSINRIREHFDRSPLLPPKTAPAT